MLTRQLKIAWERYEENRGGMQGADIHRFVHFLAKIKHPPRISFDSIFITAQLHACTRTHPLWVVLQDSAACSIELLVSWGGSGLLVLPTQPGKTLIAAKGVNNHG